MTVRARWYVFRQVVCWVAVLAAATPLWAQPATGENTDISRLIEHRVHKAFASGEYRCRGELVCGLSRLPDFYGLRSYTPAWIGESGDVTLPLKLLGAIRAASSDGLKTDDYHPDQIAVLIRNITRREQENRAVDRETLADLELLCTDAFLMLGSHMLSGRVNPEDLHPNWLVTNKKPDLIGVLQEAVSTGDIRGHLQSLLPGNPAYRRLKEQLGIYRLIDRVGQDIPVDPGGNLKIGSTGDRVRQLRGRLTLLGDLDTGMEPADPAVFDPPLEDAVRRYQQRHGLLTDGIVGPKTLAALNVPANARARQIELNMERWRWLPRDLGDRHILVNIAGFSLNVVDSGQTALEMRVVVGRTYRKTPVFSDRLRYMVINPHWNVPHRIAAQDILPKIQRDPSYLGSEGFAVLSGWGDDAVEIEPATVDWSTLNRRHFPYRLRQSPGPHNALGRIKFMFPNRFSVYLHDTPSQGDFRRITRAQSSGCIRLEHPLALADYLMGGVNGWGAPLIQEKISTGQAQVVSFPEEVPIHILYWTAWVDAHGVVQFREDIYGRDAPLDVALKQRWDGTDASVAATRSGPDPHPNG